MSSGQCDVSGLDLGTSGLRALLLREDASVVGSAEAAYPVSHPHRGWSEQDPADWIAACETVVAKLRMWTGQPGVRLYNGPMIKPHRTPLPGQAHVAFAGLCREAQGFANALNTQSFPSVLCAPDAPYRQPTGIEIAAA